MNCARIQEFFADSLANGLDAVRREQMQSHMAGCAACREEIQGLEALWSKLGSLPEPQPDPASAARFQAALEAFRLGQEAAWRELPALRDTAPAPARRIGPPRLTGAGTAAWRRLATALEWRRLWAPAFHWALASGLFALGLGLGIGLDRWRARGAAGGEPPGRALVQLREEVASLKQLVLLALLKEQSASDRLQGVAWSRELSQPDDQVLSALLRALDSDPNVNVRLAAVDALRPFAGRAPVRRGLLESLVGQQSPMVQIELIDVMVELKARELAPALQALLRRTELDPAVRERAEWGLRNLG